MAKGIRGNIIRSRTGQCNRENRPSHKRRMAEARFGVYRQLAEQSAEQLGATVSNIERKINPRLAKRLSAHQRSTVTPNEEFGITYLKSERTATAIRKKDIDLFAGRRILTAATTEKKLKRDMVIPLAGLQWSGSRETKLVLAIGHHEAEDETKADVELQDAQLEALAGDVPLLENVVTDASAEVLAEYLETPDHITLLTYSGTIDPRTTAEHKREIMDAAYEHIVKDDICIATLGGITVGRGYSGALQLAA